MIVRHPKIDYANVFPHWAPHLEFAQRNNAISITPVYMEPYLIKMLQMARPLIDPKDTVLLNEIDLFIAQESQHFRQHIKFNRCFQDGTYPKLAKYEERFKDELADFLANKPLKFNLAYAEGFESMGAANAATWFEDFKEYRVGAKEEALKLWDWHMAEEFEHREVCYKVFMAIYARGPIDKIVNGYFYRIWGCWFAMKHLGSAVGRIMYHFLSVDWAKMSEEEQTASKARLKELNERSIRILKRRMIPVLSPFYNPKRKKAPKGMMEMLKMFEPGGQYGREVRSAA